MRILIIIPSYNEEGSLERVVSRLRRVCPEQDYIIVNDGSVDNTEKLCAKKGYSAIHLPQNVGLAGAMRVGIRYALENGYDAALQFDADGQHLPEYINDMVACMAKTVIGSRYCNAKMPLSARTVGSKMLSGAIRATAGKTISDPTSGMRLYKKNVLRRFLENPKLSPEPDALAYFLRMGADVREVQVEMEERKTGQSYLTPVNAAKYMAKELLSIYVLQRKWETCAIAENAELENAKAPEESKTPAGK